MSKLKKLVEENEQGVYHPTVEDCQEWFDILNEELFDNKLSPVHEIDIRWRRLAYAYYRYVYDDAKPGKEKLSLLMNKRYSSKKFFVEILAHELVHHYQFLYHDKRVNHGPTFMRWHKKLKAKGLKLSRKYVR